MPSLLYFLLWAGVFVVMMRFGCGSHIFGHGGHGHGHEHGDTGSTATGGGAAFPEDAKDPVCGKTLKTAAAKSSAYGGRVYYFCSATCRDKFEAAPNRYAAAGAGSPAKEHHHAC